MTGDGAAAYPGRWNELGVKMVYTAESRSLASLEILVNVEDPQLLSGGKWVAIPLAFGEELLLKPTKLPADWREWPPPSSTRDFGSAWAKAKTSAIMRVPSAVTLGEFNYLINPAHPGAAQIRIGKQEPFKFDHRIIRDW